jgi:hypothetical protein
MKPKPETSTFLRTLAGAALVLGLGLFTGGCASTEGAAPIAKAPAGERVETQTGSNLPRKANKPSNVVVVDPESMQGAARGAPRGGGGTGP